MVLPDSHLQCRSSPESIAHFRSTLSRSTRNPLLPRILPALVSMGQMRFGAISVPQSHLVVSYLFRMVFSGGQFSHRPGKVDRGRNQRGMVRSDFALACRRKITSRRQILSPMILIMIMIMDTKVDIQHREKDGVLLLSLYAVSLVVSILITWYDFVRWEGIPGTSNSHDSWAYRRCIHSFRSIITSHGVVCLQKIPLFPILGSHDRALSTSPRPLDSVFFFFSFFPQHHTQCQFNLASQSIEWSYTA
jgi:hypothetical protein